MGAALFGAGGQPERDDEMTDARPTIGALSDLPAEIVRALLLAESLPPATIDLPDGGLLADVDWGAVRADANAHAVGVLVFRRLGDLGWTRFVDPAVAARWEADAKHAELQYRIQRSDALTISRTLAQHGIRHAFVKGTGYRELLYRPGWTRLCGDSDILIDRRNAERVRALMHRLDFEHAACTLDYQLFRPAYEHEIAETEAHHYELAQLVKSYRLTAPPEWLLGSHFKHRAPFTYERLPQGIIFRSVVDVHWALHFELQYESPLDDVRTVPLDDGSELPILSLEWSLFASAFKLYYEAFDRPGYGLHHLTDLAALLRYGTEPLNWDAFADLVQRHRFEAAVFYTLSAAEALAGGEFVPPDLMAQWAALKPPSPATRVELGDFVPWMLGRRQPSAFLRTPSPNGFGALDESEAAYA